MGVALALEAAGHGADVALVLGPSSQQISHPSVKITSVVSAAEMHRETMTRAGNADIIVLAAAVSDYTPSVVSDTKMKRQKGTMVLELKPTVDIAAEIGRKKKKNQVVVGFALETNNAMNNALAKLTQKNLDMIVLNSLDEPGAGFGYDTNKVTVIDRHGQTMEYHLKQKEEVAKDIFECILGFIKENKRKK